MQEDKVNLFGVHPWLILLILDAHGMRYVPLSQGVYDYLGLTLLMLDACGMHNIFLSQGACVHNQTAPNCWNNMSVTRLTTSRPCLEIRWTLLVVIFVWYYRFIDSNGVPSDNYGKSMETSPVDQYCQSLVAQRNWYKLPTQWTYTFKLVGVLPANPVDQHHQSLIAHRSRYELPIPTNLVPYRKRYELPRCIRLKSWFFILIN